MKREKPSSELHPVAAVIAIAGTVSAVTIAECLFRVLYDGFLKEMPAPARYLVYAPPVLLALLGAVPCAYIIKQPAARFVLTMASTTIAVFVVANFRGSNRWPGFYDLLDLSRWPFILGWVAAFGVAAGLSRCVSVRTLERAALGFVGLALVWSWVDAYRGLRLMMMIVYSRHIALAAVALILASALAIQRTYPGLIHETSS